MQQSKSSNVSKYFTKSKLDTGVTEINSRQTKRHNFQSKQIENNYRTMPALDISDISGQGNTRSNQSNNRSSILLTSDQIANDVNGMSQQIQRPDGEGEEPNSGEHTSGERKRKTWEERDPDEPVQTKRVPYNGPVQISKPKVVSQPGLSKVAIKRAVTPDQQAKNKTAPKPIS